MLLLWQEGRLKGHRSLLWCIQEGEKLLQTFRGICVADSWGYQHGQACTHSSQQRSWEHPGFEESWTVGSVCLPMKGSVLVPNEAAVLVHFKGARKGQIPIPGGEAQLLRGASELFVLHRGCMELDKPLSPMAEHV